MLGAGQGRAEAEALLQGVDGRPPGPPRARRPAGSVVLLFLGARVFGKRRTSKGGGECQCRPRTFCLSTAARGLRTAAAVVLSLLVVGVAPPMVFLAAGGLFRP